MADSWKDRLSAVAQNLLTLEIDTVIATDGISAQKMPEVPLALHTLVLGYSDYLATADFQVTTALLASAADRVGGVGQARDPQDADKLLRRLQSWHFPRRVFTKAEKDAQLDSDSVTTVDQSPALALTNGAETFEALQWAAWAALQTMRAGGNLPQGTEPAVLSRINANCRQLKEAALRLEKQHGPDGLLLFLPSSRRLQRSTTNSDDRLTRLSETKAKEGHGAGGQERLFGGTVEQTARALFKHPRPVFAVDPDVTILIRKAWDIGTKYIVMQTVLQVDGDVMQVIGHMAPTERDFLLMLHKQAVRESTTQWRALFELIGKLAGGLGRVVLGD